MNLKVIGLGFMALGLLLLVYALRMNIAVEGIVNIGLTNNRLAAMLFGGFIFIGGAILFAVYKIKQTEGDEMSEAEESEKRIAAIESKLKRFTSNQKAQPAIFSSREWKLIGAGLILFAIWVVFFAYSN